MSALSGLWDKKSHHLLIVLVFVATCVVAVMQNDLFTRHIFLVVAGATLTLLICGYVLSAMTAFGDKQTSNIHQIMLAWIPGLLATGMAIGGLYLVAREDSGGLRRSLGLLLFSFETAILISAGIRPSEQDSVRGSGK